MRCCSLSTKCRDTSFEFDVEVGRKENNYFLSGSISGLERKRKGGCDHFKLPRLKQMPFLGNDEVDRSKLGTLEHNLPFSYFYLKPFPLKDAAFPPSTKESPSSAVAERRPRDPTYDLLPKAKPDSQCHSLSRGIVGMTRRSRNGSPSGVPSIGL